MADETKTTATTPPFTVGDPPGSLPDQYTLGDPPGTGSTSILPSVVAYAGPFPDLTSPVPGPWTPSPEPQTTLTLGCNHALDFKRMEEFLVRIEAKLDRIETMISERLAVREAMTEMLKKVASARKSRKRKVSARKTKVRRSKGR